MSNQNRSHPLNAEGGGGTHSISSRFSINHLADISMDDDDDGGNNNTGSEADNPPGTPRVRRSRSNRSRANIVARSGAGTDSNNQNLEERGGGGDMDSGSISNLSLTDYLIQAFIAGLLVLGFLLICEIIEGLFRIPLPGGSSRPQRRRRRSRRY